MLIDDNVSIPDPSEVPIMPTALQWGGIAALGAVVLQLLVDNLGIVDYSTGDGQWLSGGLSFAILAAVLYFAFKKHRDEDLGGYISFGRCIKLGVLIGLVSGIITAVFIFLYHSFIRPDIIDSLKELQYAQMEAQGMGEEQIEQAMEIAGAFLTPFAMAAYALIGGVFMYLLGSLIMGGIMKKNNPAVTA